MMLKPIGIVMIVMRSWLAVSRANLRNEAIEKEKIENLLKELEVDDIESIPAPSVGRP